jgi:hypothetical protein
MRRRRARIQIEMSAGELEVKSGAAKLLEGDFEFNVPELKPTLAYGVTGGNGTLKLSQGTVSGNYENTWRLSLDDNTPLDLVVSLGAGDTRIELPATVGISAGTTALIGDSSITGLEKRNDRRSTQRRMDRRYSSSSTSGTPSATCESRRDRCPTRPSRAEAPRAPASTASTRVVRGTSPIRRT